MWLVCLMINFLFIWVLWEFLDFIGYREYVVDVLVNYFFWMIDIVFCIVVEK